MSYSAALVLIPRLTPFALLKGALIQPLPGPESSSEEGRSHCEPALETQHLSPTWYLWKEHVPHVLTIFPLFTPDSL